MLVLTRNTEQSIVIGDDDSIKFTVLSINGNQVKIGVEAPRNISINREEILK